MTIRIRDFANRFRRNQAGGAAVEYGLLMGLMTLALLGALAATGDSTGEKWNGVSDDVNAAMSSAGT